MENIKSLKGIKIILTRSALQAKESVELFASKGAEVLLFPTIEIAPAEVVKELDRAASEKTQIDFLLFTSVNAVRYFSEYLQKHKLKLNTMSAQYIAIGSKTAEALSAYYHGFVFVPEHFDSEHLSVEIKKNFNLSGKTILVPRSEIGRVELPEVLAKMGANVINAVVYKNVMPDPSSVPELINRLSDFSEAYYIFTSPSTYNNFLQLLKIENAGKYFQDKIVVSIGPSTKTEIEKSGVRDVLIPENYTMESIAELIQKTVQNGN